MPYFSFLLKDNIDKNLLNYLEDKTENLKINTNYYSKNTKF